MNAKELALKVADTALEKQALSVEIMDVGQKVDYADYMPFDVVADLKRCQNGARYNNAM